MHVLVTGASGYIGSKLIPVLWQAGHKVTVLVRDKARFHTLPLIYQDLEIIEADLLTGKGLDKVSLEVDAAYYLVHSMKHTSEGFFDLEAQCAHNFNKLMQASSAKQVLYISGLSPEHKRSEHMASRQNVEAILQKGSVPLTIFRAGIVIGEGSISFEIIRDLVETLPVMVTPKWVTSCCQPIAIKDMLTYLEKALGHPECIGKSFEIGGPEVLAYREILSQFASFRGLKRFIFPVPVLTPRLSSLWLCFVTSADLSVAKALVKSLTLDAICTKNLIQDVIDHKSMDFKQALDQTFKKIGQSSLVGSWQEAVERGDELGRQCIRAPQFGVKKLIYKAAEGGLKAEEGDLLKHISSLKGYQCLLEDGKGGRYVLYKKWPPVGEVWWQWGIEGRDSLVFRPKGSFGKLFWLIARFGLKRHAITLNKKLHELRASG